MVHRCRRRCPPGRWHQHCSHSREDQRSLGRELLLRCMSQLGYWLVEALVDHTSGETFPRNGLKALVCVANTSYPRYLPCRQKRGLRDLKKAGIAVVLDHHAPPGGQAAYQTFAGQCVI